MRAWVVALNIALTLAGISTAPAMDLISPAHGVFWRVVFSSLEIEKTTSFLSAGSKLGVTNATNDVSFFIASSQGYSLSDAERARRFGWPADRMESQSRLMAGFERSEGKIFVSLAAGLSQARQQRLRQTDPMLRLYRLADRFGIEARLVPALIGSVPPSTIRGLLPPEMETDTGAVLDLNIWWRPDDTSYVHGALVGDSAAQSLWTRLRYGTRVGGLPFALGPEAAAAVGRNWYKYKVGLHVGDGRIGLFGLEAAGGWMTDETRRWGAYASLALHARF